MAKSASSVSSKASSVASSLSKAAASSSSSLSSSASKASAAASATASAAANGQTGTGSSYTPYAVTIGVFTAIIGILAALHISGQLDPLYKWAAKKYFAAEAKAEMLALQKTGSKKAEGYLKEKLKANPAADLGDGDLDDIAKGAGLGDKLGKVGGGVGDKLGF